jgi:hypothetical protein
VGGGEVWQAQRGQTKVLLCNGVELSLGRPTNEMLDGFMAGGGCERLVTTE